VVEAQLFICAFNCDWKIHDELIVEEREPLELITSADGHQPAAT